MEAPRSRYSSRHALLWSALAVLVIGAGVTVLFVARNADRKGTKTAAPAGKGAALPDRPLGVRGERLPLEGRNGERVPLGAVASFRDAKIPSSVERQQRR